MPLVYSAIVPHPPLLIPAIGKTALPLLTKTVAAYQKIEEELYSSEPETIIIISPHGHLYEGAFALNLCPEFSCDFEEFGDFSTKMSFKGSIRLAHRIREHLEVKAPLQLVSIPRLDHGTSVPLFMLARKLKEAKVMPLYYGGLDLKSHYEFGSLMRREIAVCRERVALIASGDLSHALTKKSPAKYSPKGKKFDNRLIEYLLNKDVESIIGFDQDLVASACECGLKSFAILLGILSGINYKPGLVSYEYPVGVGYLVMKFSL